MENPSNDLVYSSTDLISALRILRIRPTRVSMTYAGASAFLVSRKLNTFLRLSTVMSCFADSIAFYFWASWGSIWEILAFAASIAFCDCSFSALYCLTFCSLLRCSWTNLANLASFSLMEASTSAYIWLISFNSCSVAASYNQCLITMI